MSYNLRSNHAMQCCSMLLVCIRNYAVFPVRVMNIRN